MLWLKPFFNYYFYYFLKWTEVQAVMVDKILLEYKKLETSLHGEVDLSYSHTPSDLKFFRPVSLWRAFYLREEGQDKDTGETTHGTQTRRLPLSHTQQRLFLCIILVLLRPSGALIGWVNQGNEGDRCMNKQGDVNSKETPENSKKQNKTELLRIIWNK